MKKTALFLFLALTFLAISAKAVEATAYLTVSPLNGNYNVNDTFTVILGVNSGTDSVSGIDGIGTYSSGILELTSIVQADDMVFKDVEGGGSCTIKDEEDGKFSYACYANQSYGDKAVNGSLVKLTFKATTTGTGTLSYSCTSGSTSDSNIVSSVGVNDIITCGSNQSGSYVIGNSSSSTSTSTPTPASTSTTTTTLPKTGNTGVTVGLIAFGLISLVSAAFLKFL